MGEPMVVMICALYGRDRLFEIDLQQHVARQLPAELRAAPDVTNRRDLTCGNLSRRPHRVLVEALACEGLFGATGAKDRRPTRTKGDAGFGDPLAIEPEPNRRRKRGDVKVSATRDFYQSQ